MKTVINVMCIIVLSFSLSSCFNDDDNMTHDPILGCTDSMSLNYNSLADEDNGSCRYSKVTFYARYNFYQNIPVTKIEILIDGNFIGSIDNGFIWPNGPGNCSSAGTVSHQFINSNSIDWNTVIFLANGQILSSSGVLSANSFTDCIKLNVTN